MRSIDSVVSFFMALFYKIIDILTIQLGELLQFQDIQPLFADLDARHIRLRSPQFLSDINLPQACLKPSLSQFADEVTIFIGSYCVYHNVISVYAGLQYLNFAYGDRLF